MSQPPHQSPTPSERPPDDALAAQGPVGRQADAHDEPQAASSASLADTTGTGTIVALGCIGGTLFLIALGLLYLLVTQVFG